MRPHVENAFAAAWRGEAEVDGFNELVLRAGLTWRQVVVLRAYAKYLRQAGTVFSQEYMESTFIAYPEIAALLVALFEARFVAACCGCPTRSAALQAKELVDAIGRQLDDVASLDQDRILRSYLTLIQATLRTSFYQRGADGRPKSYVAFKLDPQAIPDLPAPRPKYEIFVYSPRFEGVHLRFGAVARGGLRWSDRREDFRTEVLGLVKAQMVKNAVIVPVGAKGGFVLKQKPGDRDEAVLCYQRVHLARCSTSPTTSSAARSCRPRDVVRHDGDDPYLVVAADKGTATFSDIANEISVDARLLARRRVRLRRLGRLRPQEDGHHRPRRVGVGQAALPRPGRRHPDRRTSPWSASATCPATCSATGCCSPSTSGWWPRSTTGTSSSTRRRTPPTSYAERRRLFDLPRSSWADYDTRADLRGRRRLPAYGQVDPDHAAGARGARPRTDDVTALSPAELMQAILQRAGRPAVERRHRHLRQGLDRDQRRGRRQGQRRDPGQRHGSCGPRSSARAATSG